MTTLHIAFVWHMHQPLYLDPVCDEYIMPWVGFHAVKGYYDMPLILEECEGARAVFNLTPVLIRQLMDYANGDVCDTFRDLTLKPAEDLNPQEKCFILGHYFMCNWNTMIKPFPGYARLLSQRGTRISAQELEHIQRRFTAQDLRDLQVWYNLAWFGQKALERKPGIKELQAQGRDFTEKDKSFLLKTVDEIAHEVLEIFKRLDEAGRIEVTTTPFYHPIMPLICDTEFARRCMPGVNLPPRFSAPDDVKAQVEKAVALHTATFGKPPRGMWPSEGSVAPEIIPIVANAGIKWMATDEDILLNSIHSNNKGDVLYKPYRAVRDGASVTMVFRDRGFSDRIGFDFAQTRPEAAVDELTRNLQAIRTYLSGKGTTDALVSIILDGENPWEAFPDSGLSFLRELYHRLVITDGFKLTTVSDYIAEHPPQDTIENLFTGSWIEHNFRIWIGHPEENQAWAALGETRRDLVKHCSDRSEKQVQEAWEEFYAAEGSDWFWWYGDDFTSDMDAVFDQLFRNHLLNAYRLLDLEPPVSLDSPFIFEHETSVEEPPKNMIAPVLDGQVTGFFEWEGAGHLNIKRVQSAMYRSEAFLDDIYYGFDDKCLYLRLDPTENEDDMRPLQFRIFFLKPREQQVKFTYFKNHQGHLKAELRLPNGEPDNKLELRDCVFSGKIIEVKLEYEKLKIKPGEQIAFRIDVLLDDLEVEQHPSRGFITICVPDENYKRRMWRV